MERRRALLWLGLEHEKCVQELDNLEDQNRDYKKAKLRAAHKVAVLMPIHEKLHPPYKFLPATRSRLADFMRAVNRDWVLRLDESKSTQWVKVKGEAAMDAQSILMQQDWAALIREPDGDVIMPFPNTAFEFEVCGFPVIAFAGETSRTTAILSEGTWVIYQPWQVPGDELEIFLDAHIRGLCIALDAEVAETEVVRAQHAGMAKRADLPEISHHVVSLGARHRTSTIGAGEGRGKRLHFRRGHWRHYETSKTWVRWTLVGDVSLGYVEKTYVA